MSEEIYTDYKEGDIVWVKLGPSWWPGEVKDLNNLPPDEVDFKRPPLVVVKFFEEDAYEFVKSYTHIYQYNCKKKNEFIKKGMAAFRSKVAHMEKFPRDVTTAEVREGGNPNILSDPAFRAEKKRNYVAEVFGTNSPKKSKDPTKKARSTTKHNPKDTAHITHRRFLGLDDYKAYICIQFPGKDRIPGDSEDEEVIRINTEPEHEYNCHLCSYSTKRLEVMILHTKSHIQGVYVSNPKRKRPTVVRPRKKEYTKKRISYSDNSSSDDLPEPPREKKRKTKSTSPKKPQKKIIEEAKPKPITDIRNDLLAEWEDSDDDFGSSIIDDSLKLSETRDSTEAFKLDKTKDLSADEFDTEIRGNENGHKEVSDKESEPILDTNESKECSKPQMDRETQEAIKSCFDFDEDDEEDVLLNTTVEIGRKIPRVIPPTEKRKSELLEDIIDLEEGIDKEEILKVSQSFNEKISSKESEELENAFKDLMDTTSVPKLPEVENSLKPTQNFHVVTTIKFPDKEIESPKKDREKRLTEIPINPKKRFVKSFEDFENQLQQEEIRRREEELFKKKQNSLEAENFQEQVDEKESEINQVFQERKGSFSPKKSSSKKGLVLPENQVLSQDQPLLDDETLGQNKVSSEDKTLPKTKGKLLHLLEKESSSSSSDEDVKIKKIDFTKLQTTIMSKIIEEAKIPDESRNRIMAKMGKRQSARGRQTSRPDQYVSKKLNEDINSSTSRLSAKSKSDSKLRSSLKNELQASYLFEERFAEKKTERDKIELKSCQTPSADEKKLEKDLSLLITQSVNNKNEENIRLFLETSATEEHNSFPVKDSEEKELQPTLTPSLLEKSEQDVSDSSLRRSLKIQPEPVANLDHKDDEKSSSKSSRSASADVVCESYDANKELESYLHYDGEGEKMAKVPFKKSRWSRRSSYSKKDEDSAKVDLSQSTLKRNVSLPVKIDKNLVLVNKDIKIPDKLENESSFNIESKLINYVSEPEVVSNKTDISFVEESLHEDAITLSETSKEQSTIIAIDKSSIKLSVQENINNTSKEPTIEKSTEIIESKSEIPSVSYSSEFFLREKRHESSSNTEFKHTELTSNKLVNQSNIADSSTVQINEIFLEDKQLESISVESNIEQLKNGVKTLPNDSVNDLKEVTNEISNNVEQIELRNEETDSFSNHDEILMAAEELTEVTSQPVSKSCKRKKAKRKSRFTTRKKRKHSSDNKEVIEDEDININLKSLEINPELPLVTVNLEKKGGREDNSAENLTENMSVETFSTIEKSEVMEFNLKNDSRKSLNICSTESTLHDNTVTEIQTAQDETIFEVTIEQDSSKSHIETEIETGTKFVETEVHDHEIEEAVEKQVEECDQRNVTEKSVEREVQELSKSLDLHSKAIETEKIDSKIFQDSLKVQEYNYSAAEEHSLTTSEETVQIEEYIVPMISNEHKIEEAFLIKDISSEENENILENSTHKETCGKQKIHVEVEQNEPEEVIQQNIPLTDLNKEHGELEVATQMNLSKKHTSQECSFLTDISEDHIVAELHEENPDIISEEYVEEQTNVSEEYVAKQTNVSEEHVAEQPEDTLEKSVSEQTGISEEHVAKQTEDTLEKPVSDQTGISEEHVAEQTEDTLEKPVSEQLGISEEHIAEQTEDTLEKSVSEQTGISEEHVAEQSEDTLEKPVSEHLGISEEHAAKQTEDTLEKPVSEQTDISEEHVAKQTEDTLEKPVSEQTVISEHHFAEQTEDTLEKPVSDQLGISEEHVAEQTEDTLEKSVSEQTGISEEHVTEQTEDTLEKSVSEQTGISEEHVAEQTEDTLEKSVSEQTGISEEHVTEQTEDALEKPVSEKIGLSEEQLEMKPQKENEASPSETLTSLTNSIEHVKVEDQNEAQKIVLVVDNNTDAMPENSRTQKCIPDMPEEHVEIELVDEAQKEICEAVLTEPKLDHKEIDFDKHVAETHVPVESVVTAEMFNEQTLNNETVITEKEMVEWTEVEEVVQEEVNNLNDTEEHLMENTTTESTIPTDSLTFVEVISKENDAIKTDKVESTDPLFKFPESKDGISTKPNFGEIINKNNYENKFDPKKNTSFNDPTDDEDEKLTDLVSDIVQKLSRDESNKSREDLEMDNVQGTPDKSPDIFKEPSSQNQIDTPSSNGDSNEGLGKPNKKTAIVNDAEHSKEVEILCASNSPDSFRFSIQTNLSNLSRSEEISAIALATLSGIKSDLESGDSCSNISSSKQDLNLPEKLSETEMVAIESNLTVMSEKDLADAQVEITTEKVISSKKPVMLSNFSMDFSDSTSDSGSLNEASNEAIKFADFEKGTEFTTRAMTKELKPKLATKKTNAYDQCELLDILEGNADVEKKVVEFQTLTKAFADDIMDFEECIPSQIVCTKQFQKNIDHELKKKDRKSSSVMSTTSKLLERSTDTKNQEQKNETGDGGTKNIKIQKMSKPIILSEQIIKPATAEVKKTLPATNITVEDIEDVEAFVIHKDLKKNIEIEQAKPTPTKAVRKPRVRPTGKAKILQQTIITPAGEIIQPSVTLPKKKNVPLSIGLPRTNSEPLPTVITTTPTKPDTALVSNASVDSTSQDDNIFDIFNMPIVLSDQILTPESIENMPIVIDGNPAASKPTQTLITTPSTKITAGKVVTKVISSTTPTLIPSKLQNVPPKQKPRILQSVPTKASISSAVLPQKPGKYIIVSQNSAGIPQRKPKTAIMRKALPTNVGTKIGNPQEIIGNKIMVVTNQQGQQQRLLLTPAQQKVLGYQSPAGPKLTKTVVKSNILQKNLTPVSKVEATSSKTPTLSQKIVATASQFLSATTPKTVKSVVKSKSTAFQKTIPTSGNSAKTILIRNKHGQTIKKIATTEDDIDKQVAEQLKAIKASTGMTFGPQSKVDIVNNKSPKPPTRRAYPKKQEPKFKVTSSPTRTDLTNPPPLISTSKKLVPVPADLKKPIQEEPKPPERPLNQLVIQDALGNQTTITEGQILALPSETVDGQPQSYMLVTLDHAGNLTPLNNEALMSLDPNLGLGGDLSNMVLQIDQGSLGNTSVDQPMPLTQHATVKLTNPGEELQAGTSKIDIPRERGPLSLPLATEVSHMESKVQQPIMPAPAEASVNIESIVSNSGGEQGQQLIVTGDPIATQKFLESLTEGTTDLANIIANAEGKSILIQADGQQILINTNSDSQLLANVGESTEGGGNPIFATQPNKNTDILAAALADTDVFTSQPKISQLSPNNALYPMNVGNVLETSLTLSSPIMTPLEVPSIISKKIPDEEADILSQVPKNVDLPITITDPNISQTVANQQVANLIANELHTNLELGLGITETTISTVSAGLTSPGYSYSLPSLDESDMSHKPFNSSMPLLNDDVEETASSNINQDTDEEKNKDGLNPEGFLEEESRFTLGGGMCSSLSEPPPEMFDIPEVNSYGEKNGNNIPFSLQSTPDPKDDDNISMQAESSSEGSCEIPLQPKIVANSVDLSEVSEM